jgi:Flp pilus assembly CpaE family ATPase
VVVDFGVAANLPFTRAALEMCGLVLLVVDPTMKSVAKVTTFLEGDAAQMGLPSRSHLVVNRIIPASRYRAQDLARIFGFQACTAVPEDTRGADKAAKKRIPLALLGKGKACREIRLVTEEVVLAGIAGLKVGLRLEEKGFFRAIKRKFPSTS